MEVVLLPSNIAVNGPSLGLGKGLVAPNGEVESSMAVNVGLPCQFGDRALRRASLWQILHLKTLPKRSF
eukprot:4526855-Lingulodinium_polyedra.AAC.1